MYLFANTSYKINMDISNNIEKNNTKDVECTDNKRGIVVKNVYKSFGKEDVLRGIRIGKERDFPENTGIIIETPGFIPDMSGYANLKLLAALNSKIDKNRIKEVLKQVRLEKNMHKKVGKYSLGMRQRLGIDTIYNVRATLEGEGLKADEIMYMGTIPRESESKGEMVVKISSLKGDNPYGETKGTIMYYYEDANGTEYTYVQEIVTFVTSPFSENKGNEKRMILSGGLLC